MAHKTKLCGCPVDAYHIAERCHLGAQEAEKRNAAVRQVELTWRHAR